MEVRAAEITKMGFAFEADHVIAAMSLLRACIACRASLTVELQIIFGSSFFGRELEIGPWKASEVLAMPARFADFAEGEGAIFADGEAFCGRWQTILAGIEVVILWFFADILRVILWRLLVWAASWALAPLTGAVDGISIRLEPFLPLQLYIPLNCLLIQRDLQQFARFETSALTHIGVDSGIGAIWRRTFHIVDIALCDTGVIEVLQTWDTENMRAQEQSVTHGAFLWFCNLLLACACRASSLRHTKADTTLKCLLLKLGPLCFRIEVQKRNLEVGG